MQRSGCSLIFGSTYLLRLQRSYLRLLASFMGIRTAMEEDAIKLLTSFERLFPRYIKFFAGRALKRYKKRGIISDYTIKTRRKAKYHYVVEIDLYRDLNRGGDKT